MVQFLDGIEQTEAYPRYGTFLDGVLAGGAAPPVASTEFITTWQATDTETITLPTSGSGYTAVTIDWGDGTVQTGLGDADLPFAHTYSATEVVTVSVSATAFPTWSFSNGGDKLKILSVEQGGSIGLTSLSGGFHGCTNMVWNATSMDTSTVTTLNECFRSCPSVNADLNNWDTSSVATMRYMFYAATSFNGNISSWDTSSVTNFTYMFRSATAFNQNISGWNVTAAENTDYMFQLATNFNQPIGSWTTTALSTCPYMFHTATAFNQDISGWNVSGVTNFSYMFYNAPAFNQNIGGWVTTSATNMAYMFRSAGSFNQDISGWDTSGVTSMSYMFQLATSFDQDLGGLDITGLTGAGMSNFLASVTMSTANYNATLIGFAAQVEPTGITFHGGSSKHSGAGTTARGVLTGTSTWVITDGGAV